MRRQNERERGLKILLSRAEQFLARLCENSPGQVCMLLELKREREREKSAYRF